MKKEELLHAVEFSLIGMYEQFDGVMNVYKREGVHVIQFPAVDFWEFNRAGMTRLHENNAEEGIKDVINYYNKMGSKSIAWITGPLTTPPNFSEYLEKNNFEFEEAAWGMYLPVNAEFEVHALKDVEIIEATLEDMGREDVQKMIEQAYGMPEGSGKLMQQFVELFEKISDIAIYIGYDGKKPIAFGNLVVIPGTKGAVLGGSATLPEYRKKGLYSNMVKIRKDKAKKFGVEYLIIQAKEATSAPIAMKFGFEKICTLNFYLHKPISFPN
ncbi:MAG: hypothetical protein HeimC3_22260 [Candidatus Heimdallarchaeota archaeon LC_3]|nr:MAG: hypothetical protein HeimC3_22260 [Candidatus Heimdallarchaeota archaeon LC_3]